MDKNAGNPFVYDGFDKLSHQNRTKVKKRVFFQYIDSISVSSVCHNFFFPQSFFAFHFISFVAGDTTFSLNRNTRQAIWYISSVFSSLS